MRRNMRLGLGAGGKVPQGHRRKRFSAVKQNLNRKNKRRIKRQIFRHRKRMAALHDQSTLIGDQVFSGNSTNSVIHNDKILIMDDSSSPSSSRLPEEDNSSVANATPRAACLSASRLKRLRRTPVISGDLQEPNERWNKTKRRRIANNFSNELTKKNQCPIHKSPKLHTSSPFQSSSDQTYAETVASDVKPVGLATKNRSIIVLDDTFDPSTIDPNDFIVLDETICSDVCPNEVSADSEGEVIYCDEKTIPVISVESDDDCSVIAISDDEVLPNPQQSLTEKVPDFIPVKEVVKSNKKKKVNKEKSATKTEEVPTPSEEPKQTPTPKQLGEKRPIVVDGSNVAFSHGLRTSFSVKGIQIIVDYFKGLGHRVHVFLPQFRRFHPQTKEGPLLDKMETAGDLHYTPSRRVDGKLICSYDDRFIVEFAAQKKAIIVTRDNFRDLMEESKDKPEWKDTISKRLLQYTFVDDLVLFPDDPLGRGGPRLEEFLRFPQGETPP